MLRRPIEVTRVTGQVPFQNFTRPVNAFVRTRAGFLSVLLIAFSTYARLE